MGNQLNQVGYWLRLAEISIGDAKWQVDGDRERMMTVGYQCHAAAEKALKANYVQFTGQIPPKTHDLKRLAAMGNIISDLTEEQQSLLDKLDPLETMTRYPDDIDELLSLLSHEACEKLCNETEAFICFLKARLEES